MADETFSDGTFSDGMFSDGTLSDGMFSDGMFIAETFSDGKFCMGTIRRAVCNLSLPVTPPVLLGQADDGVTLGVHQVPLPLPLLLSLLHTIPHHLI